MDGERDLFWDFGPWGSETLAQYWQLHGAQRVRLRDDTDIAERIDPIDRAIVGAVAIEALLRERTSAVGQTCAQVPVGAAMQAGATNAAAHFLTARRSCAETREEGRASGTTSARRGAKRGALPEGALGPVCFASA